MSKINFLLKYGKEGVHYNYDDEFHKVIDDDQHRKFIPSELYKHPKFSENHLSAYIDKNPSISNASAFHLMRHARNQDILKQHHIEKLFDMKPNAIDKADFENLPGVELSPKIGHWIFDNGNIYNKIKAVKSHSSVARKVLNDIHSSRTPDHEHPTRIWEEALKNKKAVSQSDIDIAKKSGHSMVKKTALDMESEI